MKYALGLIECYGNEFDKNLVALEKALMKAQEQRVDLVLFGEKCLGEIELSENSTGFFQLRMLATNYDTPFGIGFTLLDNEGTHNAYGVFNKDGSLLSLSYETQQSPQFTLKDKTFTVVIGQDGFSWDTPVESLVLWPVRLSHTPKEWFNEGMGTYRNQCAQLSDEVILVNLVCNQEACQSYGGGFYVKDQKFILNQPMEQVGLSIFDD